MLRKLGFWQEGTLHEHFYEDGAFHDVSLFRHVAPRSCQRDEVS
jgi:hypothetical protein